MKNRLAELRNRAGLSQAELGAALTVSRQTVNAVEKGRFCPSLPLAFRMADYFSLAIEDIFDPGEGGPVLREPEVTDQ